MNDKCVYEHKWTYKEIVPLFGTIGIAFIILIMVYLRLAELYHHEKQDWEIDRQKEEQVLNKLDLLTTQLMEDC